MVFCLLCFIRCVFCSLLCWDFSRARFSDSFLRRLGEFLDFFQRSLCCLYTFLRAGCLRDCLQSLSCLLRDLCGLGGVLSRFVRLLCGIFITRSFCGVPRSLCRFLSLLRLRRRSLGLINGLLNGALQGVGKFVLPFFTEFVGDVLLLFAGRFQFLLRSRKRVLGDVGQLLLHDRILRQLLLKLLDFIRVTLLR